MERSYIGEILEKKKEGKVLVEGWLYETRDLGKIKFLLLRDISGTIQITAHKDKTSTKLFGLISAIPRESVLAVEGKTVLSKKAPGGVEIIPEKIEVLAIAEKKLPIDISNFGKTGLDKRLDWRSLDLRNEKNSAIFKIQAKLVEGMQEWLNKNGFLQVFTPCIMGTPSESGAEVFQIIYFDKPAFLRQDPQLHRQLTIAGGLEKIYDIGPSWRAEKSHTIKHLCEHRTCAVELAFINNEYDVMKVEEQLVINALKKVKENCEKELKKLGVEIKIPKPPFPVLEFPGIYKILREAGKKIKDGEDLDSECEKILEKYVKEKYNSEFYFINKFPHAIKPFYVMREGKYARSTDLYFNGLELSSGGQREHRFEEIIKNIKERKMNLQNLEWFTKFFRFGVPPHGGFAIGIERFTQMLLKLGNIREACLFTRDTERLLP